MQIETIREPFAAAPASAARTCSDGVPGRARPGTTIVSACARTSSPCSTSRAGEPSTGTGPGVSVHTVTTYGLPSQLPNAWTGMPKSRASTPGSTSTATWWGRESVGVAGLAGMARS